MMYRSHIRGLTMALLVFGLFYEAGHLNHYIEHARHHADVGHRTHSECRLYSTGFKVEDTVKPPPTPGYAILPRPCCEPSPASGPAAPLPEPRAPPASS